MKLRLIEGWRSAWRLGSVQLAALVGIIAGVLSANPVIVIGLLTIMPQGGLMQIVAAVGVALIVFAIPAATRLLRKTPPVVCPEEGQG